MTEIIKFPPIPDLSVPSTYEAWYLAACNNSGISKLKLAEYLIEVGSEIALLRAANIIGTDSSNQDLAFELSGKLMCANDIIIRLHGKYQSAWLTIRASFLGAEKDKQAPITVQTALPTLLDLLNQLDSLTKRNQLSLELEMKIYYALAESYIILEEFQSSHLYASKLCMIAPTVGSKRYISAGKGVIALCLLMFGNEMGAISTLRSHLSDPEFSYVKHDTAVQLAYASFWNGDDTSLINLLNDEVLQTIENQVSLYEEAKGILCLTLRGADINFNLKEIPNRTMSLAKSHILISEFLKLPPYDLERKEFLRQARSIILEYSYNQQIWLTGVEKVISSLCSIKCGEYGLASQNLPRATDVLSYPTWAKYLTLSTILESKIRFNFPGSEGQLFESYVLLKNLMNQTPDLLLKQIGEKLQLLTPWAMSFMAVTGGVPEHIVSLGMACILNLKTRLIRVYGKEGLRPLQAAEYTLASFDIEMNQSGRLGGGQLDALTRCLSMPFGENIFWYEPVTPARLIVALITLSQLSFEKGEKYVEQVSSMAALSVTQQFGITPQLQQAAKNDLLIKLEHEINKVLYNHSELQSFWRFIDLQRGNL